MNFQSILTLLKGLTPILEPLGEQGVTQLFVVIDQAIANLPQNDFKDAAKIFSPAFKAFALLEIQKLKGA